MANHFVRPSSKGMDTTSRLQTAGVKGLVFQNISGRLSNPVADHRSAGAVSCFHHAKTRWSTTPLVRDASRSGTSNTHETVPGLGNRHTPIDKILAVYPLVVPWTDGVLALSFTPAIRFILLRLLLGLHRLMLGIFFHKEPVQHPQRSRFLCVR